MADAVADTTLDDPFADIAERSASQYWGKYRGIVAGVDDDDRMGKITVRVPSVYGDQVSPPALPAFPLAGDGHGFVYLPEEGDGVWVEFEGGNPTLPIWSGMWFARNEMPKDADKKKRAIVTSAGLKVILDDDGSKLQLLNGDDAEITLGTSNVTIRFGTTKVVVDRSGVSINDTTFKVTA